MSSASYYAANKERWKTYRQNREDAERPICAAEVICGDKTYAKGFCKKHYKRWYRYGVLYSPKALAGLKTEAQRKREYYEANRELLIAKVRARRWADVEASRDRERLIRQRRSERHRADARARHYGMESLDRESFGYQAVLRRDPCAYCGGPMEQIDHIEPIADGGRNHWTNLTAACWPCNREKSAKPLLVHLINRR